MLIGSNNKKYKLFLQIPSVRLLACTAKLVENRIMGGHEQA